MDENTQITPADDTAAVVAPEVTEEVVEAEAPVATEDAVIVEEATEEVVA